MLSTTSALIMACGDSGEDTAPLTSSTITGGQPVLRTIKMRLADATALVVEVADTPDTRAMGLSGRSGLEEGAGMLFVWDDEGAHTLWMKDMLFALDFVWLDQNRTVVSIDEDVEPQPGAPTSELERYIPEAPAKYAIELTAGQAAALNIEPGDVLVFNEAPD
jgi:uncharacterized membrane protein (UPF0127 family)